MQFSRNNGQNNRHLPPPFGLLRLWEILDPPLLSQTTDFLDLIIYSYSYLPGCHGIVDCHSGPTSLTVTFGGEYTPHAHCDWGLYFTEDVIVAMTIVIIVYYAVTLTFYVCILGEVKVQHARQLNMGMDSSPGEKRYIVQNQENRQQIEPSL